MTWVKKYVIVRRYIERRVVIGTTMIRFYGDLVTMGGGGFGWARFYRVLVPVGGSCVGKAIFIFGRQGVPLHASIAMSDAEEGTIGTSLMVRFPLVPSESLLALETIVVMAGVGVLGRGHGRMSNQGRGGES